MLALIGCGNKKREIRIKASDMYIGTYFRYCLKYARTLCPDENIRIISAKYGLLPLDRLIDPYDMKLGAIGSISAAGLYQQAREQKLISADPVIIICGSKYQKIASTIWQQNYWVLENSGSMGFQIKKLKNLMNARGIQ